ncbi:hypothetical protein DIPPA_56233, partial [Diplonema papillatum]
MAEGDWLKPQRRPQLQNNNINRRDERVANFLKQRSVAKLQASNEKHANKRALLSKLAKSKSLHASPRKKALVWSAQKPPTVSLTPEETQMALRAFTHVASYPLFTAQPSVRGSGSSAVVLPTLGAVCTALQMLGVFFTAGEIETLLSDKLREKPGLPECRIASTQNRDTAPSAGIASVHVAQEQFLGLVLAAKQASTEPKQRDDDLLEAYTGLGGSRESLTEGGIPARNLLTFMKELGINLDEKARIDDLGDLKDFDYDASEKSDDEHEETLSPDFSAKDSRGDELHQHRSAKLGQLLANTGQTKRTLRLWGTAGFAVVAAVKLRKKVRPWFLDESQQATLPRTKAAAGQGFVRLDYKPAARWEGRMHGYYFTRGILGLGYYRIGDKG